MAFARLGAYNNGCKWLSKVIHRQWNSWLQLTAGAYSMHYYAIRKTGAIVADNYILRNNINLYTALNEKSTIKCIQIFLSWNTRVWTVKSSYLQLFNYVEMFFFKYEIRLKIALGGLR